MERNSKMKNLIIATTDSYKFLPLERALQGLSRVGFKSIELLGASEWKPHYDASTATEEVRAELGDSLNKYDLKIASLSGHSNLASEEGFFKFHDRLEFAASMKIKIVNTGVGDLSSESKREVFYKNIRKIAITASSLGITVALEPHGNWAPSGKVLTEMIAKIGSESIKINYDTANVIFYSGLRPEDDIKFAAKYVAHVHLKDKLGGKQVWNFPGLGQGDIDFNRIFDTLKQAGYNGPFSVEIELTHETERNGELIDKAFEDSLVYLKKLNRFEQLA
jgi:sugar phosphate isomerase/epimerase